MSNANTKISRGEVIVLTHGEYSDYGIIGYIIALKDFDMQDVRAQVKTANDKERRLSADCISAYELAGWLVANEYALPVAHREFHCGDYSLFDDMERVA